MEQPPSGVCWPSSCDAGKIFGDCSQALCASERKWSPVLGCISLAKPSHVLQQKSGGKERALLPGPSEPGPETGDRVMGEA